MCDDFVAKRGTPFFVRLITVFYIFFTILIRRKNNKMWVRLSFHCLLSLLLLFFREK